MDKKTASFYKGLGRAFSGAIIFSVPLFMTMEMWYLGFYIDELRLILLILLTLPLLGGLNYISGFRKDYTYTDLILDALVAFAVGTIVSIIILLLFNVINFSMSPSEIIGKIILQTISASFGATLARVQLGIKQPESNSGSTDKSYLKELFIMAAGALFFSFNMAPTEEMILISYKISEWHALALIIISLVIFHSMVYYLEYKGEKEIPEGGTGVSVFIKYTIVGYAIVTLLSLYVLWTFGNIDGASLNKIILAVIVLSFPASIGAAAARLML